MTSSMITLEEATRQAEFQAMQKAKEASDLQHWRWTIAKDVLAALNTTPRPMSNDQMIGKAVEQADLLIAALKGR